MNWYCGIAAAAISLIAACSYLSADDAARKEHDIKKVQGGVSVWVGPGWYGDYYFDDEDDYNNWNGMVWVGPGWYGGYWFGDYDDFNNWHGHHYHDNNWHGHHDHGGHDHHGDHGGHGGHGHGGGGHGHGGGGHGHGGGHGK